MVKRLAKVWCCRFAGEKNSWDLFSEMFNPSCGLLKGICWTGDMLLFWIKSIVCQGTYSAATPLFCKRSVIRHWRTFFSLLLLLLVVVVVLLLLLSCFFRIPTLPFPSFGTSNRSGLVASIRAIHNPQFGNSVAYLTQRFKIKFFFKFLVESFNNSNSWTASASTVQSAEFCSTLVTVATARTFGSHVSCIQLENVFAR